MDGETKSLLDCLDAQRAHVTGILEGLSEEALRRPVLPSGWSSLGLVHHLAVDVERFWFRVVVAGETFNDDSDNTESAWKVPLATPSTDVFDLYRAEIEEANAIVGSASLDDEPKEWPDFFGDWRLPDVRAIVLHVIAETACHAGHLDAVRELVDGRTWMMLT
jgi:hypothetical protein